MIVLLFFLFEIKLKVIYIDLNFKLILITEDAEDVKPGHVTWRNIMGMYTEACLPGPQHPYHSHWSDHMTRSVTGDSLERDKHLINCSPTRASFGECRFPQHKRRRCPCSSVIVTGDGSCSKAFFLFHIDGMCFNFLLSSSVHVIYM